MRLGTLPAGKFMAAAIRISRSAAFMLAVAAGALLAPAASRAVLPSALHFQGVLTDDLGLPISDTLAMTLRLYADTTEAALWSVTKSSVVIRNGFYELDLSVPDLPFDEPYYFGVEVAGSALGPKRPLAAVPYALRSARTRVSAGEGLTGTSDSLGVHLSLADGGVTEEKIAAGSAVKSINGIRDHVILEAGTNIAVAEQDSVIRISAVVSGGVADDDWEVVANDMFALPSGNVGIGTGTPGAKLDVTGGDIRTTGRIISTVPGGTSPLAVSSGTLVANLNADLLDGKDAGAFAEATHVHAAGEITSGTIGFARLPVGAGADQVAAGNHTHEGIGDDGDWTVEGGDVYRLTGNVGVGTDSPEMRLDVSGSMRASGAIYLGTKNGADDDFLYFDSGTTEWIAWDDAQTRFELSDDMAVGGPIAVGSAGQTAPARPYSYFAVGEAVSPAFGEIDGSGDLYVQQDMEVGEDLRVGGKLEVGSSITVGHDSPDDDDALLFDDGSTEKLVWANAESRFELSDELAVGGPIAVGPSSATESPCPFSYFAESSPSPVSGLQDGPGDLYVQKDLEVGHDAVFLHDLLLVNSLFVGGDPHVGPFSGSDDDLIYFDSSQAEWMRWDDGDDRFELSAGLAVPSGISVGPAAHDSVRTYNYMTGNPSGPSPGSGAMSDAGDLYVASDIEAGSNIYVGGDLVDLSPGPAKADGSSIAPLSIETALRVLRDLRPVLYPEAPAPGAEQPGGTRERIGMAPDGIPDLVAAQPGGIGSRPFDLIALLVRIIQEQQATIDRMEARLSAIEEGGR